MKKIIPVILILGFAKWWFTDPTIHAPSNDVSFSYIVEYSGNSGRSDTLPMLIALHGNGDTAQNFYETALDQYGVPIRIVLLKGPLSYSGGDAWPWTAEDMALYGPAVSEVAEMLALKYPTMGKPVLLGFSGGGIMAYYQAAKHGNSYSYIFPVSGQLSKDLLGNKFFSTGAGTFAFHGKRDNVISISGGKKAASILRENGVKVKFTEFDGGHLGIFSGMKTKITQAVERKLSSLN